jgi:glycerol uptake facilitator protein
MNPVLLGEFLGTAILILLGGGVCAGASLERTFARNAGWIVITAGWAFAVACGIFVATSVRCLTFSTAIAACLKYLE